MHPRLARINAELSTTLASIDDLETRADGRDLTEQETSDYDTLITRAEQLRVESEPFEAQERSRAAAAEVHARLGLGLGRPTHARARTRPQDDEAASVPSIAEYLSLRYRAEVLHDDEASELLIRTVADVTTANHPGILPSPILGPLLNFTNTDRPVVSSTTQRPHPGTKTWTRPELYQHVAVGLQAAELDELSSNSFAITGATVTSATYGGVLRISEQDYDFTAPSALQIAIDDFRGRYARRTEQVACTALAALATTTTTYTGTNIGTVIASYANAIEAVYSQSEQDADTIWLARDVWAALSGSVTAMEQSTFALLREALANEMGRPMRFVRGNFLPNGTRIIGASQYIESYERDKGFVQSLDVSHLGVLLGYRGYFVNWGAAKAFTKLA